MSRIKISSAIHVFFVSLKVFKNLFQDGLEIQKERVRELRTYAKEQREMRAVKQQNELESLEN